MNTIFGRLPFLLLICFVSLLIAACGSTIRGTFTKGDTPAEGWTVFLRDSKSGKIEQQTPTDANGQYAFQGVAEGEYEIVMRFNTDTQSCEFTQSTWVTGDDIVEDIHLPDPIDVDIFNITSFFGNRMIKCE